MILTIILILQCLVVVAILCIAATLKGIDAFMQRWECQQEWSPFTKRD